MKVAAILPAYNEADRVGGVLSAVQRAASVDEVIVVSDGSTDNTADVVREFPHVLLVDLPINLGKGGAMAAGAEATDADILLFLDADLIGLRPDHVEALVLPVKTGRYKMTVGRFSGGRKLTDWAQRLAPNISGQRAIRRDVFELIPDLEHTRYGVEMAITRFCHHYRVPSTSVLIPGITHPMKEEKLGFLPGVAARIRMYGQILRMLMDPRAPKRKPRSRSLFRKLAASDRLQGRDRSASLWLYRRERALRKQHRTASRGNRN